MSLLAVGGTGGGGGGTTNVTVNGLGPWSGAATYTSGEFISFGGIFWKAVAATAAGESPSTHPAKWQQLENLIHCTLTAHGLTEADNGKPIGWQTAGGVAVWDDAATLEYPVGILHSYISTDTFLFAPQGSQIDIPAALTSDPAGNSRFLYWDKSDGVYETAVPGDSVVTVECIYYIAENADGTHKVLVLP